jgi:hypothetical protein
MQELYTASEAMEVLGGIKPETLKRYVEDGKIRKVVPPTNRKRGFYLKEDVDNLAKAMQDFVQMHSLTSASNTIRENAEISSRAAVPAGQLAQNQLTFSQATIDEMEDVYEIAKSLPGDTTSVEARKALLDKCPQGNYLVKYRDKVVAFIHIQPLKHDRMLAFMKGEIKASRQGNRLNV